MKIKLGHPKMGPRINNPRAAMQDAAIIAVLQEQKQAADAEFTQMKAIRTSSNLPAMQSQPSSGPGVAARVAINKPGTLNKAGAGPTAGPGKVSDAPGNSSSSLARLPNIDATVATCGHDPTMRILKGSGDS